MMHVKGFHLNFIFKLFNTKINIYKSHVFVLLTILYLHIPLLQTVLTFTIHQYIPLPHASLPFSPINSKICW